MAKYTNISSLIQSTIFTVFCFVLFMFFLATHYKNYDSVYKTFILRVDFYITFEMEKMHSSTIKIYKINFKRICKLINPEFPLKSFMYIHVVQSILYMYFNCNLTYISKWNFQNVPCIMTEIFLYFVTPQTNCNLSPGLRQVKVIEPVQN